MSGYEQATWGKWVAWTDAIRDEIYDLHHHHEIWRTLVDLIEARSLEESGYFLDAFTRMYVAGQAMGVRRQADTHKDVISLARLLDGLAKDYKVVTRERFFSLWELDKVDASHERGRIEREFLEERAEDMWSTFAGERTAPHLDQAVPLDDRQRLHEVARKVIAFADRTLAHTDKRGVEGLPTFDELHSSMRQLGTLYGRYRLLLTGSAPAPSMLAPVIQGDWLAPFRQPLT
jgi:hypothetical protein